MAKDRSNEYFLKRLEREHPAVYADVVAKKLTVNAACIKAGLKKPPGSLLDQVKRSWLKLRRSEQKELIAWIRLVTPKKRSGGSPSHPSVDPAGRLTVEGRKRLDDVMDARGMTMGEVMHEIGFDPLDQSVSRANARGTRLRKPVAEAIEAWLDRNRAHWKS